MCVCMSLHMVTCIHVSACYQICQYVFAVLFKQSDVAKFFRETMQRVKELVHFGGFLDCEYLRRTLAKEFQQMESRYFFLAPFHFHQIVVLILVSFYDLENLNKYEKRALIASLKKTIYIYIYIYDHGKLCLLIISFKISRVFFKIIFNLVYDFSSPISRLF